MVVLPNPAVTGQAVTFDGCPSHIELYLWDFDGNGTTDAEGRQVQHTYAQAGSYQASLTVDSGAEWCSKDTDTETVTVLQGP